MAELIPFALQDAPALIEAVFPAQKVSFEAQRERKAGAGQTLTALGSYWKGRKPLILVRAIVLGSLLPQTDDTEKDLEIFEKLMAFDENGLARRALENKAFSPKDIAKALELDNPWGYFTYAVHSNSVLEDDINRRTFPLDPDREGISLRWQNMTNTEMKLNLYARMLHTLPTYEARAGLCKRPEEMNQDTLYAPIWPAVNAHLGHLGIDAYSHQELVEQLGILRFGHRPKVGDTFAGGGSIPFESARLGCDVYASDLNPIACMLTWGALNIIGASPEKRAEIEKAQLEVARAVDREITELGIEHDSQGNRAKAYLYCLETRCPDTGWMVPLSPSWVISKSRNVVARLIPDPANQRFDIEVVSGVSEAEMEEAERGTVQDGFMTYTLEEKTYRTPVRTIRGDYRDTEGNTRNRLRRWEKHDFQPRPDDIFQERLYCIQWITKDTLDEHRKATFFTSVTDEDIARERKVEQIVSENMAQWQEQGLVPDMAIEPGDKTDEPIRTRGWTYWHHLFTPRNLLTMALHKAQILSTNEDARPFLMVDFATKLHRMSRLSRLNTNPGPGRMPKLHEVFDNQALNCHLNYGTRAFIYYNDDIDFSQLPISNSSSEKIVKNESVAEVEEKCALWVTDPPYADAIHYHEITEFFIAWLRKNPPAPFNEWTWDSRRALAIKGSGDDFRRGMIDAYKAMTEHMPDNGMQCVMFTHQDTGVWSDMVGIFWAAGLQVVGAWYIATETTSELKKGGYVQGTVILMLRKRPAGDNPGFKQRIMPAVRREVDAQIKQMMHLNEDVKGKLGEPVFNDSDLQMAGYAAALKVLTGYTSIGGEDVTAFALRPRQKGQTTVVDEIVQQASEVANSLLVPQGLQADTWNAVKGIQRFYLRMMDMETTGASKLDNYQNFAKAFRVQDYAKVMASLSPNKARLKGIHEFKSRELTDTTEIGPTYLGKLIVAIQELMKEKEPQVVVSNLQEDIPSFMDARPVLIDMTDFIAAKSPSKSVRSSAEILSSRLRNQRLA